MASPQISVVRTPVGVVAPGTQVSFTVTATDSDARSVSFVFSGTDQGGHAVQVTESVVVSDPVSVSATVSDPGGAASTPTQDPANPAVWRSTV